MTQTSQEMEMTRIVRDIHAVDGLIAAQAHGADRPVFPRRDKRKRPVIWLEPAGFNWLSRQKMLQAFASGFVLKEAVVDRLSRGESALCDIRNMYTPGQHKGASNVRSTPLDRLARLRGCEKYGRLLSAAEVEAGHALARDYHRAGEGQIATQDFTCSGVQGGDRHGAAERAMLSRITASTRLRAAREILGADLAPGVIALCCRDESLERVERAQRWARGSGKQIVKLGLARLVTLYGTEAGVRPRMKQD